MTRKTNATFNQWFVYIAGIVIGLSAWSLNRNVDSIDDAITRVEKNVETLRAESLTATGLLSQDVRDNSKAIGRNSERLTAVETELKSNERQTR